MKRTRTTPDTLALFAALAVHGAILGGAHFLPPVSDLLGSASSAKGADMELVSIDTSGSSSEEPPHVAEVPENKPIEEHANPQPVPSPTRGEAAGVARSVGRADVSPDRAVAEVPAGKATAETAARPESGSATKAPAGDEYDRAPEKPAFVGLNGLIGNPAWMIPGAVAADVAAPAPTTAPERAPLDPNVANRVISSTLRSRDKKTGVDIPAASVVAGTVAVAMRSVSVPHNTHATFEVKLGPGGKVLSTRVVSASAGEASQWDTAAKNVSASLAKQTLPLGPEADKTGVTVRVSVTQKHVLPAGTSEVADIKPKCANGILNEIVDAADDKPTALVKPKVPMFQDEYGRPCIPVGIDAVSDFANIGAQKQIQVETSFQVILPGQVDLPADINPINTDAPWVERGKEGPRPTLPQKVRKMNRDREKKK